MTQKRVALYARVSTDDKGQDPELQLRELRDYAKRRGWLAVEFVDRAAATDFRRRTAWRAVISEVRRGRLSAVLVWKLDRAFRSTQDALVFLDDLKGWNADFVLTTEGLDTTTPGGKMLFTMFAAFAEFESARLGERVRAGMANAKAKGVHVGRPRLTDNERLMARFETLRPAIAAGEISKRQAAKRLRIGQASLARLLAAPGA